MILVGPERTSQEAYMRTANRRKMNLTTSFREQQEDKRRGAWKSETQNPVEKEIDRWTISLETCMRRETWDGMHETWEWDYAATLRRITAGEGRPEGNQRWARQIVHHLRHHDPPSPLGELLNEFTRKLFENWRRQLELVQTMYSLDDNNMRILIDMKLKRRTYNGSLWNENIWRCQCANW